MIPHPNGPSYRDNPISRDHFGEEGKRWQDFRQRNPNLVRQLPPFENRYRSEFRKPIYDRGAIYRRYYADDHFRFYYSRWFERGFRGGYWYPVRPCYDVYNYFYSPVVFWLFYVDNEDNYWNNYYPGWGNYEPVPTPAPPPPQAFPFAGVFYPTDTLKDLGLEISAMDQVYQGNFQTGIIDLVSDMQDEISAQLQQPVQFHQYEVVVNYYQNLQDQAIVLEGFADVEGLHYGFKALLDLVDPNNSIVFVPNQQNPDGSDTTNLDMINQRIVELGGDPYSADQEPLTAPPALAIDPE